MSGTSRDTGSDVLFDLPLGRGDSATAIEEPVDVPAARPGRGSVRESVEQTPEPVAIVEEISTNATDEWPRRQRVTLRDRLTAGVLDLGVAASVLTIVIASAQWMGVDARLDSWPGYATFLLAFSFLYFVIPLSFWGQTPGMSWAGITARWDEDLPLSFGQSTQRWIGTILSLFLLGLPLLLGERTLTDRISGTTTVPARDEG